MKPQPPRKPEPPPAPESVESDRASNPLVRLAIFVLGNRLEWAMTLAAAMILAAAGLFLTIAWQIGPQVLMHHIQYAKLTGHADARIVESWLALDVDLASIRHADYWRASALASPCMIVELAGDWGTERRRGFCGTRLPFSDSYDVPFLAEMSPGVPFVWARDERGFALPEIRITPRARAWLETHEVDTFMHRAWPAKNALDWMKLEINRPVDLALAGWMAPAPILSVVYDPARTDVLLPKGLVESRLARHPAWILSVIVGGIGLGTWVVGMRLLPLMQSFIPTGQIVFAILPLLTIPWWADDFPNAMRVFSAPLASVLGDMFRDIDPLDRFAATAPGDTFLADGERIVSRAGDGPYTDTFGRLLFTPPASRPATADAALSALAQSATNEIRALDGGERVQFFTNLRRDKTLDLRAAGIVAVPAARQAVIAADTDPAVRRAARAFLLEWTTSPTEQADPHLPAYDARVAVWRSLADVPVPEIANMVR